MKRQDIFKMAEENNEPLQEKAQTEVIKEKPAVTNWENLDNSGFGDEYTEQDRKDMESMYEATLNQITEK